MADETQKIDIDEGKVEEAVIGEAEVEAPEGGKQVLIEHEHQIIVAPEVIVNIEPPRITVPMTMKIDKEMVKVTIIQNTIRRDLILAAIALILLVELFI